jgi:Tfp pilus assembly protein PilF
VESGLGRSTLGMALLLIDGQKPGDANKHLEAALRQDPKLPEAHYALAGLLANRGDWQGAAEHYRTAVQFRPNYPTALNNLGVTLMHLKQTDQAIDCFREAVRRNPQYGEAQEHLAQALAAQQGRSE